MAWEVWGSIVPSTSKLLEYRFSPLISSPPTSGKVLKLPGLIDRLILGDCRSAEVMQQAGIDQCRAVLLATQEERVNLEAALTARVLNPRVRLVMRSGKQNLNDLMEQQLQNFCCL